MISLLIRINFLIVLSTFFPLSVKRMKGNMTTMRQIPINESSHGERITVKNDFSITTLTYDKD